ncbi:Noc2-domain-containing protein [Myriangium duriaei CBS 260.36]|uniref:Noc2-domain-containing protein n=1 Tax=Myriangium duriaei CBS 260.36 TaxID=1168546 RepID=A0A9P4J8X2_9PEZI|nr:Noc2-domain-containing protein [Myriangium duriaei CBS 260.36]
MEQEGSAGGDATKKFEKHHLKDTIKRRKDFAKIKQRHAIKAKKQARRAADNHTEPTGSDEEHRTKSQQKAKKDAEDFENMNVDDFFQADLDIEPDMSSKANKGRKRKRGDTDGTLTEAKDAGSGSESSSEDEEQDFEAHKKQMSSLAEKDPEFHKYLQENDPDLLDLEEVDFKGLDGTEAESDDDASETGDAAVSGDNKNEVTLAVIKKWDKSMAEQHSLRATREVVLAFRAAAHASEEEEKTFKYSVSSPEAYHELLVLALNRIPDVLQHHLPVKESSSGKIRIATESKKYQTLAPLLKSYFNSIVYLLGFLSDALTLRMTLTALEVLLPYALSFKKIIKDLTKTIVGIWSISTHAESSRLAAFLAIRRLIVIGDPGIRESVLKSVYQGLVKGSRNTTVHTIAGVNLMKNSAAELWGIDSGLGYTTGFSFIRQLAIHLRSSITNNANESYKLVYNWQYIHSLDFWSRVLSAHCDSLTEAKKGQQSPLRPLIYPVVQVTLGALRLIPTAAYFPLRFHLTRALLRISAATGTYIPLAASLHEVLTSAEMRKPPKGSSVKPLDFSVNIRAPKGYLGTRAYQDGVGEQVQELLGEFFVLWTKSIAFPELALPAVILLKRWLKDVGPHSKHPNQNAKISGMLSLVVQKLDANCKWIEERRAKVDFAPNNRAGVEGFLKDTEWTKTPLGAFVAGQRKQREEKAKVLEEARLQEEERKKEERAEKKAAQRNGKAGVESDEEESEDEDVEMEVDDDSE